VYPVLPDDGENKKYIDARIIPRICGHLTGVVWIIGGQKY
jgi:hypothetical protein